MNASLSKLTIAIVLVAISHTLCYGQSTSNNKPPIWINNPPQSLNSTYYLKVVEVDAGLDLSSARMFSQKELISSVEREFSIKVSEKLDSQSVSNYNNENVDYTGKDIYSLSIESDDEKVLLYYEKIDEYYFSQVVNGRHIFKLYSLFAVASPNILHEPKFDDFIRTNKYGANGLWRSAIVPGWGQFYKGSKVKGVAFLGVTVAFVGGIIATENIKQGYYNKIGQTYDVTLIKSYSAKIDNLTTTRNICIGGAIAVYVYNLVDAIVAPGARRVVVKNRAFNDFAFSPVVNQDYCGDAISYKF